MKNHINNPAVIPSQHRSNDSVEHRANDKLVTRNVLACVAWKQNIPLKEWGLKGWVHCMFLAAKWDPDNRSEGPREGLSAMCLSWHPETRPERPTAGHFQLLWVTQGYCGGTEEALKALHAMKVLKVVTVNGAGDSSPSAVHCYPVSFDNIEQYRTMPQLNLPERDISPQKENSILIYSPSCLTFFLL